jgi:hypothetical protein
MRSEEFRDLLFADLASSHLEYEINEFLVVCDQTFIIDF